MKRVLRYVITIKNLKLIFRKPNHLNKVLDCFVDADWADDSDRKSISGCIAVFLGNAVLWATKKQQCITLSSTEAEYMAVSAFTHDILIWIVDLISELNVNIEFPITIHEDNLNVINLLNSDVPNKRSKHIDIRCKFIKELTSANFIELIHINTCNQIADIFTKSLDRTSFEHLRKLLNLE